MESRIDPENRTTNLYDPHFCYSENEDNPHVIGGYVQNFLGSIVNQLSKGLINWMCTYIQGRQRETHFYHYKKISYLKAKKWCKKKNYTLFTMKPKDLCDHDPSCIISCGLMCDDIIRDYIKRMESSKHPESSKKT